MRCLLVALLLLGLAPRVLAQSAAEASQEEAAREAASLEEALARPGYVQAFQAGLDEFGRGSYLEARARFAEAHAIWANARTWRVLGYCAYELGEYPAAIDALERALGSNERPLSASLRSETEDVLRRARGYVASITVHTTPPDATVRIDGTDAKQRVLLLAVGHHALDVSAPEHYPAHRELEVASSEAQMLHIDLNPIPELAQGRDQPLRKKWWLWTGVGAVAAAALVTGLVLGLRDAGVSGPTGGSSGEIITVGGQQ